MDVKTRDKVRLPHDKASPSPPISSPVVCTQKVLMALGTGIRDTFLVQAAIKTAVVGAHQHRDRLERWQVGTKKFFFSGHVIQTQRDVITRLRDENPPKCMAEAF